MARKVNPTEWFQQFSLCSGYAHVRLPQLPVWLLSPTSGLPLLTSFLPFPTFEPLLGGRIHPQAQPERTGSRERPTQEKGEQKTEKIYWLQKSPWFSTLVKLPRLRIYSTIDSHSFSFFLPASPPFVMVFSSPSSYLHLQPWSLPRTRLLWLCSLLASFLQNWTARRNSQFATSTVPLTLCLVFLLSYAKPYSFFCAIARLTARKRDKGRNLGHSRVR